MLSDVFDLDHDDSLINAIGEGGCMSVNDIIFLQDTEIDNLEFEDKDDGCKNILDPTFMPATVHAVELHDAQQKFMHDVFLGIMKTDRGVHFVRKHSSTKDAQSVWRNCIQSTCPLPLRLT